MSTGSPARRRLRTAPAVLLAVAGLAGAASQAAADPASGSTELLASAPQWAFDPLPASPLANAGGPVSVLGDVNGDGIEDYALGAPGRRDWTLDPAGPGVVFVMFGAGGPPPGLQVLSSAALPAGTPGFVITTTVTGDRFGQSVDDAGDVNGDGYDDIVIGAPGYPGDRAGAAYVIFGGPRSGTVTVSAGAVAPSLGFAMTGQGARDGAGQTVAGAGDVNGDGLDDVMVGSTVDTAFDFAAVSGPALPTATGGNSWLVFGARSRGTVTLSNSGMGTAGVLVRGAGSVGGASDVNGDGRPDLVVGAPEGGAGGGAAYVIHGGPSLGTTDVATLGSGGMAVTFEDSLGGSPEGALFGYRVAAVGDMNGDGLGDIAATGGPFVGGRPWMVYGSTGPARVTVSTQTVVPAGAGVRIGRDLSDPFWTVTASQHGPASVGPAGDVNGDGLDDLIYGITCGGNRSKCLLNVGSRAWVVYGTREDAVLLRENEVVSADGTGRRVGIGVQTTGLITGVMSNTDAVSGGGDLNADGRADFMVGAANIAGVLNGFGASGRVVLGVSPTANRLLGWRLLPSGGLARSQDVTAGPDPGGTPNTPPRPAALATAPDGRTAIAAGTRALPYDVAAAGRLVRSATRTAGPADGPASVVTSPVGSLAYTANRSVLTALGASGAAATRASAADALAIHPTGRAVYAYRRGAGATLEVWAADPATGFTAATPVIVDLTPPAGPSAPRAIAVTPDGRYLLVRLGTGSGARIARVPLDPATGLPTDTPRSSVVAGEAAIALSPDGRHLYVAAPDGVRGFAVDPVSGELSPVAAPTPAARPAVQLLFSPDGRTLLGVESRGAGSGIVRSYTRDPATGALTAREGLSRPFPGAPAPQGLAFLPAQGPSGQVTATAAAAGAQTAFAATASDPDGTVARFDWDFGDGTVLADGGATPGHVYAAPGRYRVTVRAVDDEGCAQGVVATGVAVHCNPTGGPITTEVEVPAPAAPSDTGAAPAGGGAAAAPAAAAGGGGAATVPPAKPAPVCVTRAAFVAKALSLRTGQRITKAVLVRGRKRTPVAVTRAGRGIAVAKLPKAGAFTLRLTIRTGKASRTVTRTYTPCR